MLPRPAESHSLIPDRPIVVPTNQAANSSPDKQSLRCETVDGSSITRTTSRPMHKYHRSPAVAGHPVVADSCREASRSCCVSEIRDSLSHLQSPQSQSPPVL